MLSDDIRNLVGGMSVAKLLDMSAAETEKLLGVTEAQMADYMCLEIEDYRAMKLADTKYHHCEEMPGPADEPGTFYVCSHGTKWVCNEIQPGINAWSLHVEGIPYTYNEAQAYKRAYIQRHPERIAQ